MYFCGEVRPHYYIAEWRKVDQGKAGLPVEVIALLDYRIYYPAAMPGSATFALGTERGKEREPLEKACARLADRWFEMRCAGP